MNDDELLELIRKLQRGQGKDDEVGSWVLALERSTGCPSVSDLIFYGDPSATPEQILAQAKSHRKIAL